MKIRIDKYLADMGAGSRTEIKDDIKKGLVYINGNKVKSAGEKADTLNDEVTYKENIIKYIEFEYIDGDTLEAALDACLANDDKDGLRS